MLNNNTPFDVLTAKNITVSGVNLVITTHLLPEAFMDTEFTLAFNVPTNIGSVTGSIIINSITYAFDTTCLTLLKQIPNQSALVRIAGGKCYYYNMVSNKALSAGQVAASDITGTLSAAHGGTGQTSLQATRNAMGLGNTLGVLPVANGGTGQNNVKALRDSMGLGNTLGVLPIANGGTNANSKAGAKTQLGFATMVQYTGTIGTGWGGSNPYTIAVTINGILASDIPVIDVTLSGTLATDNQRVSNWASIHRCVTAANRLTFYAYNTKPTVNLPFRALCIR